VTAPDGSVVFRPRRLRVVCWATAVTVVALFTLIAIGLGSGPPGDAQFKLPDQIALVLLSLLLAGGVLVFTRARVVGDAQGLRVRNAFRETALPWAVVVDVRLDEHGSWAYVDLQDDDTLAVLALQANDGEQAQAAVRALQGLLAASRDDPPAS
jgi:hypothetical protein